MTTTTARKPLDRSIRRTNLIVGTLLRLGVPLGPMRLLTVPGRRTGVLRTTPIATFSFEGRRYLMQGFPGAAWAVNARAAGWGLLRRGLRNRRVNLVEIALEERRGILLHVAGILPDRMLRTFVENGLIESPDQKAFIAATPAITVFRVDDAA
jgi:hypothetical protein